MERERWVAAIRAGFSTAGSGWVLADLEDFGGLSLSIELVNQCP
jgi:hypothetical protein